MKALLSQQLIEQIVEEVLAQLQGQTTPSAAHIELPKIQPQEQLQDITSQQVKGIPLLQHPQDPEGLARMKTKTSARIGVGRAGPRLNTQTLLTLRADHAIARDAVFSQVDSALLERLGLPSFTTRCSDKNIHLTRPDLGREFEPETLKAIVDYCGKNADVLIIASDGLSSKAIEANLPDILPILTQGLTSRGLKLAKPIFVRFGRVPAQDHIAEATGAKVVCTLIGERPGLATAESMSAYIAYEAKVGMPEARRTVVSNIHGGGVPAVEAGAYIAELIAKILAAKASGVDFKQ